MSSIIQIQNLSKSFDGKKVLDDISIDIPSKGIFGVIGLNGTGKTTTIKCILNLIPEYEGQILFNGKSTSKPENRKHIAYIPEKFSPNQNITAYEYIKFYSDTYKTPFQKDKIDALAQDISLDTSMMSLKIKQCSKGTVQKIGILACLYVNADVIILDEPTSGLDILARKQLKETLIKHAQNKAIVFSSHILSDIQELAQNIAVISKGKAIFIGTPNNFITQYNAISIEEAFLKVI